MIVYQHARFWQQPAFVGVLCAFVVGGALWWWLAAPEQRDSAAQGGASNSAATAAANSMASAPSVSSSAGSGVPDGVRPDDWQTITGALGKAGLSGGEADRVLGFIRYQKAFESWQGLEGTKDVQRRQQMAKTLLAELPNRVVQNEFTPVEAHLMAGVLLADTEPDEARRQQQIEELTARFSAQIGQVDDEQAMQAHEKKVEAQRKVAVTVAEWLAQSPEQRSPEALDKSLQQARR